MQVEEKLHELSPVFLLQRGEFLSQKPVQTVPVNGGHLDHREPAGQGLVQLSCSGVAVVHGANEAGGWIHLHPIITGYINGAAEVQRGVEHSQCLVFRHVDLVQDPEAAMLRAEIHRAGTEGHLPVFKGIHADETGGVHVHMKGYIPAWPCKDLGQIFRQHIFTRSLAAGQQQIFPAQEGGNGGFPDLLSVVMVAGLGDPVLQLRRGGIGVPVFPDALQQLLTDLFLL